MKIAIEGCAHGELDNIYATIREVEEREGFKIDLLICCGDFQSSRNEEDLNCMAVPPKYRHICSFYKYYSGEKKAPVLTIFIGGNHEASNYLQELPYGGWVANNIYYMGYAGVINIAGLRIGGLSGIYKARDYMKGRFEKPPYDENSKRSVYHIRNLDVFRLKQISTPIDIFLSHDWPTGVYNFGNIKQLLKKKPFFKDEVKSNQLGSKPCEQLLNHLQPKYWFAAHLHCKFAALVPHENNTSTKFLALDKCLPRKNFLQVVEIPHDKDRKIQIEYDLEWLTILHLTDHLLSVRNTNTYMPGPGSEERYNFTPNQEEKQLILEKLNNTTKIPKNFRPTAVAYQPDSPTKTSNKQPQAKLNPQTVELCENLDITDPICLISESNGLNLSVDQSFLENTTFINDSDESESGSNVESDISVQEIKIKELQLPETKVCTPMKLPKPKNEEIVDQEEEKEDAIKESSDAKDDSTFEEKILENQEENEASTSEKTSSAILVSEPPTVIETTCDGGDNKSTEMGSHSEGSLSLIEVGQPKASPKRILGDEIIAENPEKCDSSTTDVDISESDVKSNTPTPKKFKRRNADMYASEST